MGNSDKQQKDKPVADLGRLQRLFNAILGGLYDPEARLTPGHSLGSRPSPNARARRKKRLKAAKLARRAHRRG